VAFSTALALKGLYPFHGAKTVSVVFVSCQKEYLKSENRT
jgi:hypothetical protein